MSKSRRIVKGVSMAVLITTTLTGCVVTPWSSAVPGAVIDETEYDDQIDIGLDEDVDDEHDVLTDEEIDDMREVSDRISALFSTKVYDESDTETKGSMLRDLLYVIKDEGLIVNVLSPDDGNIISFEHRCGVIGAAQFEPF